MTHIDRPLGHMEQLFWNANHVQPMNVVVIGHVVGPLNPAALAEALAQVQRRHPMLRARFGGDKSAPGLVFGQVGPIPRQVTPRQDDNHWVEVATTELNTPFDHATGPLVRIHLLTAAESCDLLCTFHHGIGDASAGMYLIRDALRAMNGQPEAPPHPIRPVYELLVPEEYRETSSQAPVLAMREPATWQAGVLPWHFSAAQTQKLVARCKAQNVSVTSALSAALLLTAIENTDHTTPTAASCLVAVSTRDQLDPPIQDEFGVFVAHLTSVHRLTPDYPFWEVAGQVRTNLKRGLEPDQLFRTQNRVLQNQARLAETLVDINHFEWTQAAISNLGRLPIEQDYGPRHLKKLHFAAMFQTSFMLLSVTTLGDALTANLVYPDPHLANPEQFLAQVRQKLEAALDDTTPQPSQSQPAQPDRAALMKQLASLSPARRELLRRRLGQATPTPATAPDTHPLSYGQRSMWFLNRMAPDSTAYVLPFPVRIRATLNVEALHRAFELLAERHELLRSTFPLENDEPIRRLVSPQAFEFQHLDATGWSADDINRAILNTFTGEPFDLAARPPWRVRVYSLSPDEHVMMLTMHHIIMDFWSLVVMFKDLQQIYPALNNSQPVTLPPKHTDYSDYVRWQAQMLASQVGQNHRAFWEQQLAAPLPVLDLPTDHPRPPVQTFNGAAFDFTLEAGTSIKDVAQAHNATQFMVLVGVFQILLMRYSKQEDLLIGSPAACRDQAEFTSVMGDFMNPVVLRADLSGNPSFADYLKRVRETVLGALKHQDYPFARLVEHLNVPRDPSRSPVFQVMFVLQNQIPLHNPAAAQGLVMEAEAIPVAGAQMDLTLELQERNGMLHGTWKYNADLFNADTIARMAGHYRTLLSNCLADPEQHLWSVPMLTPAEQQQMLIEWNATATDLPEECVHWLIEAQANQSPDTDAVSGVDGRLTYSQLDGRANQLAHYLRRQGIGPNLIVGVSLERTTEMMVALLAILKAGGAYLPLDPAFPAERLRYIVENAQAPLVITRHGLLPSSAGVEILDLAHFNFAAESDAPLEHVNTPDDLAYVMYTSGSTGKPKGVEITHRAWLNLLLSMQHLLDINAGDVWLAVTTLSFDISALELFVPLLVGAQIEIADTQTTIDGAALARKLNECGATLMQATPATWRLMVNVGWQPKPGFKVISGGEALPRDLADQLLSGELWNVYGPTETTIWSSAYRVEPGTGPVSIGRPIANTQFYILDQNQQPVPIGVAGDLYIGGTGMARGYRDRPELTAERFLPDPYRPGYRMYWTGDQARYQADGNVEFLGRNDFQLKVRGFRIEAGEIETLLNQHPTVYQSVVVAHEKTAGDARLIAYIATEGDTPTTHDLRQHLRQHLPPYMIPGGFIFLDRLPLTPNGKINRRALPEPDAVTESVAATPPQNELEQKLVTIWQEILDRDVVGIHDNFFDLGGHSLLLARLHSRLQTELAAQLTIVTLLEYPTVNALAQFLSRSAPTEDTLDSVQARARRQRAARQRRNRPEV